MTNWPAILISTDLDRFTSAASVPTCQTPPSRISTSSSSIQASWQTISLTICETAWQPNLSFWKLSKESSRKRYSGRLESNRDLKQVLMESTLRTQVLDKKTKTKTWLRWTRMAALSNLKWTKSKKKRARSRTLTSHLMTCCSKRESMQNCCNLSSRD